MRASRLALAISSVLLLGSGGIRAAQYPLMLSMDGQVKSGSATVTAPLTIHVDRLMEESRRKRVIDALQHGGYNNFLNTLRPLPAVGTIEVNGRKVDIKYAVETPADGGQRLVVVADRPLFFLSADAAKPRAGFELTIADLRFDAKGAVSGTMTGAAKVKPAPDGSVVLDDFATAPVQLTQRSAKP